MEESRDSSDKQTHLRSEKATANDAIETLCSGETTTRHIPQEIIEEILVRLPVKSLLKFRCVAKSWLVLISSPKFIKTHAEYSPNFDPTLSNYRLMLTIYYDRFPNNQSHRLVSFFRSELWNDVVDDTDRPNNQTRKQFAIHSSCNGLLCMSEYHGSRLKHVFLWNPCLRMSKKLPPPLCAAKWSGIWISRYCIVHDERSDDYKVVGLSRLRVNGSRLKSEVEIYSLKNDSWKRIEDFEDGRRPGSFNMVYANGKIHFVKYCKGKYLSIVSLDLENGVYGTVELLESEQLEWLSSLSVGALKGCICALYSYARDRADVWILKEYGVKESWTKLVSIPYIDGPPSCYAYRLLFVWNGKYLLSRGSHLVVYDPKDGSFVQHSFARGNLSYADSEGIYVESLVLLPEIKL